MISIYEYLDATDFINDKFNELKASRPAFSLRAWSKHLGMKSHGPLHAILKKQRNIPKKLVPGLIKTLKLTKQEGQFLESLVDFQRAKTGDEKEFYKEKLNQLAPRPLREINDLEAYKIITDPFHILLAEMTQLKSFDDNPAWIKSHLRPNLNMRDIEVMMERLRKIGVVEKKGSRYIKPVEHIYTKLEIESTVIQEYHKTCSKLAMEEISKQSVDAREFNAIAFNIQKKDLPQIKEKLREFINSLVDEFESSPGKGDETYQLNMNLFSLTKK